MRYLISSLRILLFNILLTFYFFLSSIKIAYNFKLSLREYQGFNNDT